MRSEVGRVHLFGARYGRLLLALVLLVGLGWGAVQPAGAQTAVDAQITPLGGSNVSGMLSLWADPADGTMISVGVKGLPARGSAQVNLNAGTCALPSASVLRVMDLTADDTGFALANARVLQRDGASMPLAGIADGDHVIVIVADDRAVACGAIPALAGGEPAEGDLAAALLAEGERRQVMQFNPGAALQKRIFADGFVPNSAEFRTSLEATDFAVQRAEHMQTGAVRVYWARVGDWGNVRYAQRGARPDALGSYLLAEAEKMQAIQFNPAAALQKRIFADGFVPNSGEFAVQVGNISYTGQRAEHLGSGRVRVYHAVTGQWNTVRTVERTGNPSPSVPVVAIAPPTGPSGTRVRLSATGFPPNAVVTAWGGPVNSEGIQLGVTTADADGQVVFEVQVQGAAGMRWVFGLVAGDMRGQSPEFTITE